MESPTQPECTRHEIGPMVTDIYYGKLVDFFANNDKKLCSSYTPHSNNTTETCIAPPYYG